MCFPGSHSTLLPTCLIATRDGFSRLYDPLVKRISSKLSQQAVMVIPSRLFCKIWLSSWVGCWSKFSGCKRTIRIFSCGSFLVILVPLTSFFLSLQSHDSSIPIHGWRWIGAGFCARLSCWFSGSERIYHQWSLLLFVCLFFVALIVLGSLDTTSMKDPVSVLLEFKWGMCLSVASSLNL